MSEAVATQNAASQVEASRWPRGLLLLTLGLAIAAPLAMYSGRIPGLGEFDYLIYYRLLFYNDFTNSLAMLVAFLVALAVRPLRDWITQAAGWVSQHAWQTCVLAFVALAIAARLVYQGFPLAMDEYAPLLQARIFAQGDIAVTYPRELLDSMVVPGFQGYFILVNHETGQAASAYWPGLAILMTPFALFGGEWLLNPLLGAAGLWLVGDLARQASGKDEARGWAMLAALACPQFTVNAMSFYAMTGLLTLNLLFLWLLLRPGWKPAALAGVVGSVALVLHNPVPHALFALPIGIWLLGDSERRSRIPPLAIGYLPLTALLCLGWPLFTSTMGLRALGISEMDSGFAASWLNKLGEIFVLPGAGMLTIRSYALWKTVIWAAPGLLLVSLLGKSDTSIQRLLVAGLLLAFGFYFFVPFDQGHGWGYRYIHHAWGVIAVSAGVFAAVSNTRARNFVAASVCAGLIATPVFLYTTHKTISTSIAQQLPLPPNGGHAILFISGRGSLYTADLVRNYPNDRARVTRMLSRGDEADRALVKKIAPKAVLVASDTRGSSWAMSPQPPSQLP